ncbi:MAG TPA: four helix bundle protein [Thermoanaerobaculia bacterium]|nr:four helix bundle protein [Thermoanaerobaculia bacterium]
MSKSSYRDLLVWQKARVLAKDIYILTRRFPRTETFGIVSQMRRSAVSIACNIAEGQGRWTRPDYRRFLLIARGSTFELETQIIIAADIGYIEDPDALIERTSEIARMLNGLLKYLSKVQRKPPVPRPLRPAP